MEIKIDNTGRTYAITETGIKISQYEAEQLNNKEKNIPEEFINYGVPELGIC